MPVLSRLCLIACLLYGALTAFMYARQDAYMYLPSARRMTAAEADLPGGFEDVALATPDGERLVGWFKAPEPGKATLLFLHGAAGDLADHRFRARALTWRGHGLLIVGFRGYAGSTGSPTEEGLGIDARAAFDWLARRVSPARIVTYGESLGTGVAVRLAGEREMGGMVLDAPFPSAVDVARHHFWFLPVWLMRDQYRSIERIGQLRVPLLVLHGDRDGVTPIELGERLYAAAPGPKRFVRLPGVDHVETLEKGGLEEVRAFLNELERSEAESRESGATRRASRS